MNILLINPDSPFMFDARAFPPLGLLYVAAALEAHGHEIHVADLAKRDQPLEGFNPAAIGITCVTAQYPYIQPLIKRLRMLYPEAKIIVGGPHLSTAPLDYKAMGADCCGTGDCEEAIVEFAQDVERGQLKDNYHSPGLTTDVNKYPVPARHLIPLHEYSYSIDGRKATSIMTQRGCPYECTFCCHWEGYRKIRMRNLDNVIAEITSLKEQGFDGIMIYDDEFNLITKRTVELCNAMVPLGIRWRAFVKANLLSDVQAEAMARSGCFEICTGVESGSDRILKTIQKKSSVAENSRARGFAKKYGIRFKAFTMVGHPGETEETVQQTKRWLIENEVDDLTVSQYMPYLGTPIVEKPQNFDIKFNLDYKNNELFYRGSGELKILNASTSALSAERLRDLRDEVENDVRQALGLYAQPRRELVSSPRPADNPC